MASTFELLAEKAAEKLQDSATTSGSYESRALGGIGWAILAHAKAMEDIAEALKLHAKMQSRSSM